MNKLFTYGTLQLPYIQEKIFNRILQGTPDVLIGYEKGTVLIDGQIFGIADPKPDGRIEGVVYTLSEDELKKADIYEGREYRRVTHTLKSGLESLVYVRA